MKLGGVTGGVLLLLLAACAKPPASQLEMSSLETGIVGGTEVQSSEDISKTTVALYDVSKHALCTGSLLSDKLVLTAGHCGLGASAAQLVVIFGLNLQDGKGVETRKVSALVVNPDYKKAVQSVSSGTEADFDNLKDQGDLALVRFEGGLPEGYHPAEVLKDASQLVNQADVQIAGYGLSDGHAQSGAGVLREVGMKIYDANFSKTEILFDQRDKEGACHGDSGGPAFLKSQGHLYLFGVTSRGYHDSANECVQYSIYTNILAQSSFVQKATQALMRSPKGH